MKPIKEGKVREIYDNGDSLIMVATDRISCFDVILKNTVTKKGGRVAGYAAENRQSNNSRKNKNNNRKNYI